jgi:hypothetical protein
MAQRDKKIITIVGILLALVALTGTASAATSAGVANLSYLGQNNLPKGMRNNNPGNIRVSGNSWQGKIPLSQNTDGAFEQFTTYVYGIRAMIKNLLSYYNSGINTLQSIIYKWAPPSDNNETSAYVTFVALRTGLSPTQPLDLRNPSIMRKLVIAMSEMENGRPAVTTEQFNYAWNIV